MIFQKLWRTVWNEISVILDTIDERLKNDGFDLSSGYLTVGEYLDAEFRDGDFEKATARLRNTPTHQKV